MLLAEERIIQNELIYKYQDIYMPGKLKKRIRQLVEATVDFESYPRPDDVKNVIMQVEALYVYSVLKSVLHSQSHDPMIQKLMAKYGLKSLVAPAVDQNGTMFKKYEMLEFSEERRDDWNNSRDLIRTQTVPGNRRLVDVIAFVMRRTLAVVESYPLFELPTRLNEETLGYLLSQKEFAANTKSSLQEKLAKYPVQMTLIQQI